MNPAATLHIENLAESVSLLGPTWSAKLRSPFMRIPSGAVLLRATMRIADTDREYPVYLVGELSEDDTLSFSGELL